MNYKNDKLNIEIKNSKYFDEIKEYDNYVSLMVGGLEKFRILENSSVEAYDNSIVRAWGNSIVRAWGNSSVVAKEFSSVYIKSIHTKISTDNHFGAIIKQVFKTTKKTVVYKKLRDEKIAVLELTKGQIFQSENHDKCRTEYAKVLRIESIDGKEQFQEGCPQHDESFKYIVGEVVKSTYDEKIIECSDGIHFFLTREKAERF
jgi:hypothetical protein